jgi:hypothetical protein
MSARRVKRGYSREFPYRRGHGGRYLLDSIPPALWAGVRARARREGVSLRTLILRLLQEWAATDERTTTV